MSIPIATRVCIVVAGPLVDPAMADPPGVVESQESRERASPMYSVAAKSPVAPGVAGVRKRIARIGVDKYSPSIVRNRVCLKSTTVTPPVGGGSGGGAFCHVTMTLAVWLLPEALVAVSKYCCAPSDVNGVGVQTGWLLLEQFVQV